MNNEVLFRRAKPLDDLTTRYPGFSPSVTTLPQGTVARPGAMPLPCDILFERDVAVPLRDGTIIYTDIFRPVGATSVPAIVAWSPYGKQRGEALLDDIPGRYGVPKDASSGLEKWEGPDPGYWCAHGYAIVNPDARGAYMSEGDIHFWGTQEGQDGADLIEWVAACDWSNGKVGLSGNSWLAIAQWFIAAERPPHLVAIAPWEGFTDFYRDASLRGGIPDFAFLEKNVADKCGNGRVEDVPAMGQKYPLMNTYWNDKAAKLEQITIPAYVVASWTNGLHTPGTFSGYERIASPEKWLRVHNTHEWPDYYDPRYQEDLRRFFDHYLLGATNGWEATPRVRVSLLNATEPGDVDRPAHAFPLPETTYTTLYLDARTGQLAPTASDVEASVRYDTAARGHAVFQHRFDRDTELIGFLKLRLWVEALGADDMDLFVLVQQLDMEGNVIVPQTWEPNWTGPHGRLRVSHRQLDRGRTTAARPYHTHATEQRLAPGQIVPVEIGLTPIGLRWRARQQLRLTIAGYNPAQLGFDWAVPLATCNRGAHVIHTGGQYDSYLWIPTIVSGA
jgi:predicted acyl esterase